MVADDLVQRLPVAATAHALHEQVLRRKEGQIVGDGARDDALIHAQAARHLRHCTQRRVAGKERLREGDAAVGRIVQRTLEPLHGGGHGRVDGVGHQIAAERADALAPHGIALVGHGGRADLAFAEGFLHLPVVLEQADIGRKAVRALRDGGERRKDAAVELARIRLPAHGVAAVKAERGGEAAVHLIHLSPVAPEQLEKARLRAGRPPAAEEAEGREHRVDLLQVEQQVLHPQARPLAHRDRLGRLVMRIAERGQRAVAPGERPERAQHRDDLAADEAQRVPVQDEVGVVGDKAARRAQVDDARRARAAEPVGVHVRHHVVAHLALARLHDGIVDLLDVRGKLVHLRLRHRQAQRMLGARQLRPEPPPRLKAAVGREEALHPFAGIARAQGAFVPVLHGRAPVSAG